MRVHRHPRVPVKFATRVSRNKPRLRDILDTKANGYAPEGDRAPLFPDAFCKCEECGATLRTEMDARLHTNNTGVCIAMSSGQRPRHDRCQVHAPVFDDDVDSRKETVTQGGQSIHRDGFHGFDGAGGLRKSRVSERRTFAHTRIQPIHHKEPR